jgi:hypothetical protein
VCASLARIPQVEPCMPTLRPTFLGFFLTEGLRIPFPLARQPRRGPEARGRGQRGGGVYLGVGDIGGGVF